MSAPPVELHDQLRPPSRSPFGLGFRQPEETETGEGPATIPHPATSPEAPFAPVEELASEHDEMPDASSASPAGTSSRASTRAADAPASEGLRDFARNGIIVATAQAHTYLGARTEGQRAVELLQADADDAANIGDPLARIAGRRDGVGEMSEDSKDLLAAMMGLAGYASKQVQKATIAKKLDARIAGGLEQPGADTTAADL